MNRREREAAAQMVAEWEWGQSGGSSSEAAARAACASEVIRVLALPSEDVDFARSWELAKLLGVTDDEALFEALTGKVENEGWEPIIDLIDSEGLNGLRASLAAAITLTNGGDNGR